MGTFVPWCGHHSHLIRWTGMKFISHQRPKRHTPVPIVEPITYGIHGWQMPQETNAHALTAGHFTSNTIL
jgi:hypothetical protein